MLMSMLWMTLMHAVIFGVTILGVLWFARWLSSRDRPCPRCGSTDAR